MYIYIYAYYYWKDVPHFKIIYSNGFGGFFPGIGVRPSLGSTGPFSASARKWCTAPSLIFVQLPNKKYKNNQILSSNMILYMDDICLIFMNFFTSTSTWGRNIPPHATNHFKIASWSQGSCQEPHGGGVANPCGRRFLVFEGFLEQDDGRNWYNIFPMMGTGIKVSHFLEFHAFNVFLVVFFSFK